MKAQSNTNTRTGTQAIELSSDCHRFPPFPPQTATLPWAVSTQHHCNLYNNNKYLNTRYKQQQKHMHTRYNRLQKHKQKVPAGLNTIFKFNTNTNITIGNVPTGGAIYTKSNNENNIIHKYYNTCVTIPIVTIINILQKIQRHHQTAQKSSNKFFPLKRTASPKRQNEMLAVSQLLTWCIISSFPATIIPGQCMLRGNYHSGAIIHGPEMPQLNSFGGTSRFTLI